MYSKEYIPFLFYGVQSQFTRYILQDAFSIYINGQVNVVREEGI